MWCDDLTIKRFGDRPGRRLASRGPLRALLRLTSFKRGDVRNNPDALITTDQTIIRALVLQNYNQTTPLDEDRGSLLLPRIECDDSAFSAVFDFHT